MEVCFVDLQTTVPSVINLFHDKTFVCQVFLELSLAETSEPFLYRQ